MQISISPIQKRSIEIYGVVGTFIVPASGIRTHHFSTLASAREPNTHAEALLRELKPMRERVNASELRDLDALIQRDLNDARVAHELVPYLKGATPSGVAFFPAVLAALIPKGFIAGQDVVHLEPVVYPEPVVDRDRPNVVHYGSCWTIERSRGKDGESLPLGKLTLYPDDTDVVVLDGQHRASAFRYVAGLFGQDDDFYSAFYQTQTPVENFDADLPVTLVWFEKQDGEVLPRLIARNLFVDVNTTAQKVNRSRNILLDDRLVSSLMTRFFLSATARETSFDPGQFSLLHSGFDLDTDLTAGSGHPLTLTNPDILEYVASWLLFSYRDYNKLHVRQVSREAKRRNIAVFGYIFSGSGFGSGSLAEHADGISLVMPDRDDEETEQRRLERFEEAYKTALDPLLRSVFEDFGPYRVHYEACAETATWCAAHGSSHVIEVWRRVFAGGEGLYYSLAYYARTQAEPGGRVADYLKAVREVEGHFASVRAARLVPPGGAPDDWSRRVTQAYESMRTKAFQVGLFMAYDVWNKNASPFADGADAFVRLLNTLSPVQWVYLLTELRPALEPSVDPKKWPAYQKLILRAIQEDEEPYYGEHNFHSAPDGVIFKSRLQERFDAWAQNADPDTMPTKIEDFDGDLIRRWGSEAKQDVDRMLENAGIQAIAVDGAAKARAFVEEIFLSEPAD